MRYYNWHYFNLLREITITQLKLKDQHTFLGMAWSFLNPLLVLGLIFVMFNFKKFAGSVANFPIYLLIGMVHITHFSTSTSAAMNILRNMKSLTINTVFPKETLVMASVLANTSEFLMSLLVCLAFAGFAGVEFKPSLLALPIIVLLQYMLVLWVSLLLSCSYVFIGDLNHIYQVFLRLLFFITPVFYTPAFFSEGWVKSMVMLNPLTYLMNASRTIILDGEYAYWISLGRFFLVNLCLIALMLRLFRACEPQFAEHL
jgi:ABC-type polysaccharide/polyol phosphate export permease